MCKLLKLGLFDFTHLYQNFQINIRKVLYRWTYLDNKAMFDTYLTDI